jgi:hypothetical protein
MQRLDGESGGFLRMLAVFLIILMKAVWGSKTRKALTGTGKMSRIIL